MGRKQGPKLTPTPCPARGDETKGLIPGPPSGKLLTPTFVCPKCGRVVKERSGHRLDDHGVGSTVERMQAEFAYQRLAEAEAAKPVKPVRSKRGGKRAVVEGPAGKKGA